ncbi:MAG: hypothetical protein AEth_00812 [Candidatus Argoarchaeum ethanivorans]|uniref:Uncharacterized protein n=1 Tax=Candidatus Argoarchaeum ethanivorans TaxID=2608793 RepID=A0A8B3S1H7_9EURY|nr:MAG: hypothetical protein AEth_00812 [Candidatus Argoarchaeum ethanivorans]
MLYQNSNFFHTFKPRTVDIIPEYTTRSKQCQHPTTLQPLYSFKLLDLESKMYVAYGMSTKSEKEAFDRAMEMLECIDVEVKRVRLDRYYSFPSYVDRFGDAKVYVIPRKNATLHGSWKWKNL